MARNREPGRSNPVPSTLSTSAANEDNRDPLLDVLTSTAALGLGTLLALMSAAAAIRKAITNSMDFEWSGARLFVAHQDPWAVYLAGDPHHQIMLTQVPNYLHELYLLLLPFGLLTFRQAKPLWMICNFLFVAVLCWSVSRLCELSARKTWLLVVLVLASTPFRVTVGNGQNDALALAAIALWACVSSQAGRGVLLGLAYEKYSFPPVLVFFLALRGRWKILGVSVLLPLAAFAFSVVWLNTKWRTLAVEPFQTVLHRGSVRTGISNITGLSKHLLVHVAAAPILARVVPYALSILLALGFAAYFARRASVLDGRIILACLVSASLVCFPHMIYDFLALVFNLAVALKSKPGFNRGAVFAVVAYFWYLERIFHVHPLETHLAVIAVTFGITLWMIGATCGLAGNVSWSRRWTI